MTPTWLPFNNLLIISVYTDSLALLSITINSVLSMLYSLFIFLINLLLVLTFSTAKTLILLIISIIYGGIKFISNSFSECIGTGIKYNTPLVITINFINYILTSLI